MIYKCEHWAFKNEFYLWAFENRNEVLRGMIITSDHLLRGLIITSDHLLHRRDERSIQTSPHQFDKNLTPITHEQQDH